MFLSSLLNRFHSHIFGSLPKQSIDPSLSLPPTQSSVHFSVSAMFFTGFLYDWISHTPILYSTMDLLMLHNYFPQIEIFLLHTKKKEGWRPQEADETQKAKEAQKLGRLRRSQSYDSAGSSWSWESNNHVLVQLPTNIGQVTRIQNAWAVIHIWASSYSRITHVPVINLDKLMFQWVTLQ